MTAGAQQILAAAAASSTSKEQQQTKQLLTEQGQQGQQLHHQEPTQAVSTEPQSSCAVGEGDCVAAGSAGGSVLVALPASVEGWHVAGMVSDAGNQGSCLLMSATPVSLPAAQHSTAQHVSINCIHWCLSFQSLPGTMLWHNPQNAHEVSVVMLQLSKTLSPSCCWCFAPVLSGSWCCWCC